MDAASLPTITVTPCGRKPLTWLPTGEVPSVILAPEVEERRLALAKYIEDQLQFEDDDENSRVGDRLGDFFSETHIRASLAIVSDPALAALVLGPLAEGDQNLGDENIERWLRKKAFELGKNVEALLQCWTATNEASCRRSSSDKRAQSTVRVWYGNQCVLTGVNLTDGAHILPVRVTSSRKRDNIYNAYTSLFPARDNGKFSYRGREPTNILPLARGAHRRWDAYEFYLRPIADPVSPATRLFLQFVWADNDLAVGRPSGDAVLPDITNGRCPVNNADGIAASYPPVHTGDVFLLETADPHNCPLPSLEFLEMQAGVHRLLGGLRAAATLAALFHGPPPRDDDDDDDAAAAVASGPRSAAASALASLEDDNDLPHLWKVLLEAAVAKNVLSLPAAGHWARAAARDARETRQNMEELFGNISRRA
ncbi:hypothetical protein SCUCBS95973_002992 [Sporothrix curviconia]|uniref:HNH nuclease domain-containing protein n=1 Tax=Sporothrix curviconia TaxID=1260050 RepID=A0ABP0BBI5_9PEZI